MRFLIDGYNLLHALGKLTPRSARSALTPARRWLLATIRKQHPAQDDVIVVFDGRPGRDSPEAGAIYSLDEEADDVIEQRVQNESAPGRLTIVSDDRRLLEAARRKGCVALRCMEYCDRHLLTRPAEPVPVATAEPRHDLQADIDLFKHLDDDPELGDPY